jgi:dUTP pyrophosphatase
MLIHKLYPNVIRPERQTELSACFDIHAHLRGPVISEDKTPEFRKIKMIDRMNHMTEVTSEVTWNSDTPHTTVVIPPNSRALIPTGVVFDIQSDYSVRLHPRSGLAWKHGITLVNCEGVIDSDYREEVFIPLLNTTEVPYVVEHGDRIAQFEIIRYNDTVEYLTTTEAEPKRKTNRVGGFGSTGV